MPAFLDSRYPVMKKEKVALEREENFIMKEDPQADSEVATEEIIALTSRTLKVDSKESVMNLEDQRPSSEVAAAAMVEAVLILLALVEEGPKP